MVWKIDHLAVMRLVTLCLTCFLFLPISLSYSQIVIFGHTLIMLYTFLAQESYIDYSIG